MAAASLADLSAEQRELIISQTCPDYWVKNTTGEVVWRKQVEVMRAVALNPRVAVASGNAVGKTFLAARCAGWFLDVFFPATVITTAPTTRQVKDLLWKEIGVVYGKAKLHGRPLGGELYTTTWNFPGTDGKHFGTGFAPKEYDANRFIGYHNDHVLVIEDEAAGITEAVNEGVNSIVKGGHTRWLKIGNPTNLSGPFYNAFKSPDWVTFHISEFDSPNVDAVVPPRLPDEDLNARKARMLKFLEELVRTRPIKIPGLVTASDILKDFNAWGEDHPLWQARVLGQFPDRIGDTFIALSWVESAAKEEMALEGTTIDIGCDVARYGSANTVFVARIGSLPGQGRAFAVEPHGQQSLMVTVGRIVRFVSQIRASWSDISKIPCPLIRVKIDAVGLGAGVYDRCKEVFDGPEWRDEQGNQVVKVFEMIEHRTARDPVQYANAATEWWAVTARGLEYGNIAGEIFQDKRLMSELVARKYTYGSDGRMRAESKEDLRKRGEPSPDFGDAVVIAFADVPMAFEEEPAMHLHAGRIFGR